MAFTRLFKFLLMMSMLMPTQTEAMDDDQEDWGHTTCLFRQSGETFLQNNPTLPSVVKRLADNSSIVTSCKFCFTLWSDNNDDNENPANIISQGCWLSADDCNVAKCVSQRLPNVRGDGEDNLKFCCCAGDKCNSDFSTMNTTTLDDAEDFSREILPVHEEGKTDSLDKVTLGLIIFIGIILSVFAGVGLVIVWFRCCRKHKLLTLDSDDLESCHHNVASLPDVRNRIIKESDSDNLSDLSFLNIIGQGKYGVVYKGRLVRNDEDIGVAVKVFLPSQRKAFLQEKKIYELIRFSKPEMTSATLNYFGSQEKTIIGGIYCDTLLVTSLAERGSLLNFMKNTTVNWSELCKMLTDISKGLADLHAGFQNPADRNSEFSPSICHRDLNSRNILVRSDLTCCIADFGFSLRAHGSSIIQYNDTQVNAESGTLTEVGTVRYLSPELLDGSINLRDCESALKQADVYSIGLVCWELSRRCRDLYQGASVEDFEQAYERELGCRNPTFDQMKVLVSRNRARPLFPEIWKRSNPAIRQIQDTIEEAWDHDGEARITASCLLERFSQLPGLWERYKLLSQGPPNLDNVIPNTSGTPASPRDSVESKKFVEKFDNLFSRQQACVQIQPHQGRNLCLERNLNSVNNFEDDNLESRPLIEKSTKSVTAKMSNNDATSSATSRDEIPASRLFMTQLNAIPFVRNDFSSVDATSTAENDSSVKNWFRKLKKNDAASEGATGSSTDSTPTRSSASNAAVVSKMQPYRSS